MHQIFAVDAEVCWLQPGRMPSRLPVCRLGPRPKLKQVSLTCLVFVFVVFSCVYILYILRSMGWLLQILWWRNSQLGDSKGFNVSRSACSHHEKRPSQVRKQPTRPTMKKHKDGERKRHQCIVIIVTVLWLIVQLLMTCKYIWLMTTSVYHNFVKTKRPWVLGCGNAWSLSELHVVWGKRFRSVAVLSSERCSRSKFQLQLHEIQRGKLVQDRLLVFAWFEVQSVGDGKTCAQVGPEPQTWPPRTGRRGLPPPASSVELTASLPRSNVEQTSCGQNNCPVDCVMNAPWPIHYWNC